MKWFCSTEILTLFFLFEKKQEKKAFLDRMFAKTLMYIKFLGISMDKLRKIFVGSFFLLAHVKLLFEKLLDFNISNLVSPYSNPQPPPLVLSNPTITKMH